MKMHRFFTQFNPQEPRMLLWDPEIVHQMVDVLRLHTGEEVMLCDGQGNEAVYTIARANPRGVELDFGELRQNPNEPRCKVTLHCCILKRENFEWVAQKAVETGVSCVHPVVSRRTVKTEIKADRLQKIMQEAAEQAGRGIVPVLQEASYFHDSSKLEALKEPQFFFDAAGTNLSGMFAAKQAGQSFGIWIGPEGGWDPEETEHALALGFQPVTLGGLVLRGETAAVVASYLACSEAYFLAAPESGRRY